MVMAVGKVLGMVGAAGMVVVAGIEAGDGLSPMRMPPLHDACLFQMW